MDKIRKISVIGMGYVGLPVAVAFGRKAKVIGFDIDEKRIEELQAGIDLTNEVSNKDLTSTDIQFTTDPEFLGNANFHIIAVPTPITDAKHPDMRPLTSASEILGLQIKADDIIVYESTVYPGATEEECTPILEQTSGLKCGEDFFVGYSPERINPGDKIHTFTNIIKIVSGQNGYVLDIVADVYSTVIEAGVHKAPSIKVAEAAKVIENTQRDVNIALMNELAFIFDKLDIDTNDVLEAAGTKWNFLPFTPGLVGGHCIGIDPYYLTYQATKTGFIPDLILEARYINDSVGGYITTQIIKALINNNKQVANSVITILGLTFKENIPDIRNTRVVDIINELKQYNLEIQIHDPLADKSEVKHEYGIDLIDDENLKPGNAVILCVPHDDYIRQGWKLISRLLSRNEGVVYDVKGCLSRDEIPESITLMRL